MKFPVARFVGDRGTWRDRVISYAWSWISDDSRDAIPYG